MLKSMADLWRLPELGTQPLLKGTPLQADVFALLADCTLALWRRVEAAGQDGFGHEDRQKLVILMIGMVESNACTTRRQVTLGRLTQRTYAAGLGTPIGTVHAGLHCVACQPGCQMHSPCSALLHWSPMVAALGCAQLLPQSCTGFVGFLSLAVPCSSSFDCST